MHSGDLRSLLLLLSIVPYVVLTQDSDYYVCIIFVVFFSNCNSEHILSLADIKEMNE